MDVSENGQKAKGQIFTLDDGQLRTHVAEVVRQNVEETLNALLDAEADESYAGHNVMSAMRSVSAPGQGTIIAFFKQKLALYN